MAIVDINVVPASKNHIKAISANMRPADCAEAWAAALLSPEEALRQSLAASPLAWTLLADEKPVCMFGAATTKTATIGRPWLLGTPDIERYATAFVKLNQIYLLAMLDRFPVLTNHADARNKTSIRWLRWLGFSIGRSVPKGPFNHPFHPFEIRRGIMCIGTSALTGSSNLVPDFTNITAPLTQMGGGTANSAMGMGMSFLGQQQAADTAKQQADYATAIATNREIEDEQNAQTILDQGAAQEQKQRLLTAQGIGNQRAQMAANGVELDSGSPLDVQSDSAQLGELNSLSVRNQAERQALPYQLRAQSDGATVNMDQYQSAALNSQMPLLGSLMGGVGSMSSASAGSNAFPTLM